MHRDVGLRLVRLIGSLLLGDLALQPITAGAQNATAPAVVATQQTSAQGQTRVNYGDPVTGQTGRLILF